LEDNAKISLPGMDATIKFFIEIGKLKKMPRRGWVIRGVKNPESIAEHSFRATIMAWILAGYKNKKINMEKLLKMALVHDLCEIYAGDITPYDSILPKDNEAKKELLKTWPRFTEKQKKDWPKVSLKKKKQDWKNLLEIYQQV